MLSESASDPVLSRKRTSLAKAVRTSAWASTAATCFKKTRVHASRMRSAESGNRHPAKGGGLPQDESATYLPRPPEIFSGRNVPVSHFNIGRNAALEPRRGRQLSQNPEFDSPERRPILECDDPFEYTWNGSDPGGRVQLKGVRCRNSVALPAFASQLTRETRCPKA